LISSIPTPDVDDRWDDDDQSLAPRAEARRPTMRGCRFADRCPAVMPMCSETVPPLYRTDDRRAAACFLYRDRPTIGGANMDQVLAPTVRAFN
jgi:ABC-type dipeptide/oligopeptide/nickel transport system ATPase component